MGRRRGAPRDRGRGRRRAGRDDTRAARGAALDATRPLAVELEVETGLGRGGFGEAELVAAARTRRGRAGHRPDRPVDAFPGRRGRGDHGDPDRPVRSGGPRAGRAPAIDLPARHAAASAGLLTGGVAGLRRRPARAGDLRPRSRRARCRPPPAAVRRPRLRPVMSLIARPVRVADLPAGWGISYGPTFRTDPPEPDRDTPARLRRRLVAAALEPGQRDRPRRARPAGRERGDGRGHGRRHRRAGPAGRRRRRIRAARVVRRRCGSVPRTLAQERTTNSWEVVTGMARRLPRVYHAAARPVGLRTLSER